MQEGSLLRRILLVEDQDDMATLLKDGLELMGYAVVIAHNGPLALRLARDFQPDVAVLDLGLPVMDGWELAKRLRAQHPAMKIIAVTGYADDAARVRSQEAGFAAHLVKPVGIDAIDQAVKSIAS